MAQISKSVSPSTNLMNNESSITCDEYYHGNLWDDDCIQSLNSPYGAPEYQERAEMLIKEIKPLFWSDIDDSCCNDLIKRLEIVDTLECLGIDRHFQAEIKVAMDYVYRCWNERGIGEGSRDSLNKDLHATALGFRALRLHRYNVSSGVLEKFKDESGRFCSFIVEGGGEAYNSIVEDGGESFNKHVRCMLSLLRAANISFPGEKVMAEAKAFTTNYLKQVLAGREATHVDQSLLGEVKYALEFPWHCSVPRLEARSFIEIYGQTDSGLKSNLNQKILELAKLDFNILQCTHQKEMQMISRWFADSNIAPLNFYRKRHVEIYFWMVTAIFEAEFCASRISFTKHAVLMTMLDDLYDIQGTVEQLKIFTEGVRRWDLSLVESLPDYMKTAFKFFIKTANELIAEASKVQGRDMATYIRKNAWERYLGAYLQEAEWIESGHIPTFDEYMKNGTASAGMCIVNLVPLMLMGEILPLDILEQIYSPSRFHQLLELAGRLVDDARDFEDEKDRGEFTSCVEVYLNDHPGSTVADALNHVNGLLDNCLEEINGEFLKHDSVPLSCKKYTFNTLARGVQLMYHFGDGFSITDTDIKDQVRRALIDPVPI